MGVQIQRPSIRGSVSHSKSQRDLWAKKMRIFDLLVCALFSPTISLGKIIIYEDCGSRDAFVVAVGITPCNILPCVLMHGKPYTIEITFIASAHIKSEDALVEVLYGSVRKSFRMRSSAKFQHLDPPSPIRPGGTYKYSHTSAISYNLPKRLVNIRWQLLRQDEQPFICVQFSAKISDSS
ncbi:Phosphatidylglycerol/phosphatidylinositol transfer protein [Clonorchis sinensis]|uniref:Phosphatidylglycerol/phosphatidylinositol transfer protein n=1 Tax=Clonorchis sinensis TaxID=79923 RepID=A0A8T1MWN2_CLOSI|nr:Phosphatidylglycerol/phosphatidylinositol transfer protein [Clonorchis sinensis]